MMHTDEIWEYNKGIPDAYVAPDMTLLQEGVTTILGISHLKNLYT